MKVVFLDFDGVLNSKWWQTFQIRESGRIDMNALDPSAVRRLNRILAQSGAVVVVSSTWRLLHSVAELVYFLEIAGFSGKVIDRTPKLNVSPFKPTERGVCRGDEIRLWLVVSRDTGKNVESFVVLDDDSDMDGVEDRLVQTTWDDGLLNKHIEPAVEILAKPCNWRIA